MRPMLAVLGAALVTSCADDGPVVLEAASVKQRCSRLGYWGPRLVCMVDFNCQGLECKTRGGPLLLLEPKREGPGPLSGEGMTALVTTGTITTRATGAPIVNDGHLVVPDERALEIYSPSDLLNPVVSLSLDGLLLDQVGSGAPGTVYATTSDGGGGLYVVEWSRAGGKIAARAPTRIGSAMNVVPYDFADGILLTSAESWVLFGPAPALPASRTGTLFASTVTRFDESRFIGGNANGTVVEAPLGGARAHVSRTIQPSGPIAASAPYVAIGQGRTTFVVRVEGDTLVEVASFPHAAGALAFDFPRLAVFDHSTGTTHQLIVTDPGHAP